MTSNKIKSILLMSIPILIVIGLISSAAGFINAILIMVAASVLAAIMIYVTSKAADLWYM